MLWLRGQGIRPCASVSGGHLEADTVDGMSSLSSLRAMVAIPQGLRGCSAHAHRGPTAIRSGDRFASPELCRRQGLRAARGGDPKGSSICDPAMIASSTVTV